MDWRNPLFKSLKNNQATSLYTLRVEGDRFQPGDFAKGRYTVKIGRDHPDGPTFRGLSAAEQSSAGKLKITL